MKKRYWFLLLYLSVFFNAAAATVNEKSIVIASDIARRTPCELGQRLAFAVPNHGFVMFDLKEKFNDSFTVEFSYRVSPVEPVFSKNYPGPTLIVGEQYELREDLNNYYSSMENRSSGKPAGKRPGIPVVTKETKDNNKVTDTPGLDSFRGVSVEPGNRLLGGMQPVTNKITKPVMWEFSSCRNYYKLHKCKWVLSYPAKVAGCSVNGYHSITEYQNVVNGRNNSCLVILNRAGETGSTIEISPVSIQTGISPGGTVTEAEIPRKQYSECEKEAKKNDPEAMYSLGLCYYEGSFGAPKDYFSAFEWFKKAAARKHIFAQYYLGLCYHFGRGTEIDRQKAFEQFSETARHYYAEGVMMVHWYYTMGWWKIPEFNNSLQADIADACEQGDANAIYLSEVAGYIPPAAKFGQKNMKINLPYGLGDAAIRGNYKAAYMLGENYITQSSSDNQALARSMFELAAGENFSPALFRLAQLWPAEYGAQMKVSADSGYAPAMVKHAVQLISENKEVENAGKYLNRADAIFSRTRQNGTVAGKSELNRWKSVLKSENWREMIEKWQSGQKAEELFLAGMFVENGWGTDENKTAAYKLYQQSAAGGFMPANYKLGLDCRYGITKPMNFNDAKYFMGLAAEAGFAPAQYELAKMCDSSGDYKNSEKWYLKAVEQNYPAALIGLGEKLIKASDPKELQRGLAYLERAAAAGEPRALYYSGAVYYKGAAGLKKNPAKAAALWQEYEKQENAGMNNEIAAPLWKKMPCCVPDGSDFWNKYLTVRNNLFDLPENKKLLSKLGLADEKSMYHTALKRQYFGRKDQDQVMEYFNKYFVKGMPDEQTASTKKTIPGKKK